MSAHIDYVSIAYSYLTKKNIIYIYTPILPHGNRSSNISNHQPYQCKPGACHHLVYALDGKLGRALGFAVEQLLGLREAGLRVGLELGFELVGDTVGVHDVGLQVSKPEGSLVGRADGVLLGSREGSVLGHLVVGCTVRVIDGEAVEGEAVGGADGKYEGEVVGLRNDGEQDGRTVLLLLLLLGHLVGGAVDVENIGATDGVLDDVHVGEPLGEPETTVDGVLDGLRVVFAVGVLVVGSGVGATVGDSVGGVEGSLVG